MPRTARLTCVVTRQTGHGPVVRMGACIGVVQNHIIIIEILICERMVGKNADDRLYMGIKTIW